MRLLDGVQRRADGVELSDDPARLDIGLIYEWLSAEAYWSLGRARDVVERAIAHSWNLGVYQDGRQIAFARVVTDVATFGWLCDVFVHRDERGRGIGQWLVRVVHETLHQVGVYRILLATNDAHEVYAREGFTPLVDPERWMERDTRGR